MRIRCLSAFLLVCVLALPALAQGGKSKDETPVTDKSRNEEIGSRLNRAMEEFQKQSKGGLPGPQYMVWKEILQREINEAAKFGCPGDEESWMKLNEQGRQARLLYDRVQTMFSKARFVTGYILPHRTPTVPPRPPVRDAGDTGKQDGGNGVKNGGDAGKAPEVPKAPRKTYRNPLGLPVPPTQDTGAFATCP